MTRDDAKWVLELIRDRYSSVDVDRLSLTDAETDAINMAIRSLEAWDKVKSDLDDLWLKGYSPHTEVMEIIDRHLKEVEDDKR